MEFTFGQYRLRPVEESDRELLKIWIHKDPFHRGKVLPDFFIHPMPGEECWALEDGEGKIVFYFKTQLACRLHIQFAPPDPPEFENREALVEGMEWLQQQLAAKNFREMVFQTDNRILASFAVGRLGFRRGNGEMIHAIPPPGS